MAHGYAQSKANFNARKPNLNFNPFDRNNSLTKAGENVARSIKKGPSSKPSVKKSVGTAGDAIRKSNPVDALFDQIGNRIKQATGGR